MKQYLKTFIFGSSWQYSYKSIQTCLRSCPFKCGIFVCLP